MANKNYDNEDGVWRTIGGRRVFIRNGQSLADAMKESGKFSRVAKNQELYKKVDEENKKIDELVKKEEKKDDKKTIHTASGDYTFEEMQKRDKEVKDLYKANWNNEISAKELNDKLEAMREEGRLSYGEQSSLQYDASREFDKELEQNKEKEETKINPATGKPIHKLGQLNETDEEVDISKSSSSNYFDKHEAERLEIAKDIAKELNPSLKNASEERLEKEAKGLLEAPEGATEKGKTFYTNQKGELERSTPNLEKWRDELKKTSESKVSQKKLTNVDLKKLAESKYGSSTEDYNKLIEEQIGEGKSQKEYDDLKEQVDKVYKEEMSKKHEMLSNEEFKKLVKDTYGNMSYVNEMGLSVDQVKEQLIKDANDEIEYWKNQDKDYWKDIGAEPNQQVKAYEKLRDFASNYGNKTSEKSNEASFVQENTQHGGTREYSADEVKQMEENGVRPMKRSYSGYGWEGVNSRQNLTTSEQAKAITDTMKKKYPDVKVARKSDVYSGGSSIDFNIMASDKDIFISEKDIDKLGNEQLYNTDITRGYGFDRWAEDNVPSYRTEHTYSVDDVKRYAKEQLNYARTHENQNVTGKEWYLNDYGKKVVSDLNKEANSYTYDDSDGMIDYFNHGTYMSVSIGKWNKPYEVKGNSVTSALKNKAYQKYLKEHPGSKMALEEFKKR